jgi:porphobilinogen synthase
MAFPQQRLRRTRRTAGLRGLVRETRLSPQDFVYPIFVTAGEDVRNPVASMPGIFRKTRRQRGPTIPRGSCS